MTNKINILQHVHPHLSSAHNNLARIYCCSTHRLRKKKTLDANNRAVIFQVRKMGVYTVLFDDPRDSQMHHPRRAKILTLEGFGLVTQTRVDADLQPFGNDARERLKQRIY